MRTRNPLVILIAISSLNCGIILAQDSRRCEVKANIQVDASTAVRDNGKATVIIQEGTAPFKYVFYEETTGKLLQKDFVKGSVENLAKGSYYCIVIDNRGCTKKIQFQIQ